MEVGDQGVHDLEMVARVDEDFGPAASCFQDTVFVRGGFQGSAAGGADADDAATGGFGIVDKLGLCQYGQPDGTDGWQWAGSLLRKSAGAVLRRRYNRGRWKRQGVRKKMYKLSEKYKKYVKYKEIKNFEKNTCISCCLIIY